MRLFEDLSRIQEKDIYDIGANFRGRSASGREIAFTNYYMEVDSKPYPAVSGEIHFSRLAPWRWEDEILKMKAGGINIIATYVFWIHHEETEGDLRFDGHRDVRRFVELCHRHGLFVILRVGPFCHGEVRNGGLPDWLYGQDFQVRKLSDRWLYYTGRLYRAIAKEVRELFFEDDGPIIGVQIDNEYMHSSAPWEQTVGTTNEWVFGGDEGEAYMLTLRDLAAASGMKPVFYTATAWGGAIAPTSMLPLWGGYAYRPWLFYRGETGEHPLTDEYLYEDYHNNNYDAGAIFDPSYPPESRPYACCEMGGGMMVSYSYRFEIPYKSVDAMANIKLASGCNYLGYYMYHGGSNPQGLHYMNEGQVSKISYDYQAALGEFGQVRESYLRLKKLHLFTQHFSDGLLQLPTFLPDSAASITPDDLTSVRYALRTDGVRGYVFINNFQDHAEMPAKPTFSLELQLKDERMLIENLSIDGDENAVLPFNLDMDGFLLKYATAQPLARIENEQHITYFFSVVPGMAARFCFAFEQGEDMMYRVDGDSMVSSFTVEANGQKIAVCCLNQAASLQLHIVGNEAYLADATLIADGESVRFESEDPSCTVHRYIGEGRFEDKTLSAEPLGWSAEITEIAEFRWRVVLQNEIRRLLDEGSVKDVLMRIEYDGDVGQIFSGGRLLHDNFNNGAVWDVSLRDCWADELVLYITPLKEGATVRVDSPMAARFESVLSATAAIRSIQFVPVYELRY